MNDEHQHDHPNCSCSEKPTAQAVETDSHDEASHSSCCHVKHENGELNLPPLSPMESEPVMWFISLLMVLVAFLCCTYYANEDRVINFSVYFLSIIFEALPFMLLGTIVSGIIEVYVSHERIASLMPRRKYSVFIAALLGILFPVCECAVVPVVRRLVRKGVPLSCAIAYMLASPTINPLVTLSTGVAFRWQPEYYVGRFLGGFLIASVAGLAIGSMFSGKTGLADESKTNSGCLHGEHSSDKAASKLQGIFNHALHDFIDVTRYLVLGAFIAAFLRSFVNWSALLSFNDNTFLAPLAQMLLAFVLNLCSEADAFVAASFVDFSYHAKMAFLLLGPMLDIKLISMYSGVYSKRTILAIVIVVPILVFLTSLALFALANLLGGF